MKYLEELSYGTAFIYNNQYYILTNTFKSNNDKLCYSLVDGSTHWFKSDQIVYIIQLCFINESNTIIPIKESKKNDT